VLNESTSISLVLVDVLVDSFVTNGEGAVHPEVVGDLLWTPILFQQSDDVVPEGGRKVKAASFAFTPGSGIAMGQIGAILTIDELLFAFKFPRNRTRGTRESPCNFGFGSTAYAKLSDMVPFVLRELSVATQV
jgi:hypothetical protein